MLLFTLAAWKKVATIYFPEAIAALVVLLTFFPSRALEALWPWYGQLLGRFVHRLARVFVPELAYLGDSNPTLSGPDLDVTIVPECSGINGLELFDYLFGVVAVLAFDRLYKWGAVCSFAPAARAVVFWLFLRNRRIFLLGNRFVAR